LNPDECIYIAFDGVAPVAKLEQQRSRRYKSLYQNTITRSIFTDIKTDPWNTTAITPGTAFMQKVNEHIKKKFHNPDVYHVKQIIFSGSDEYGEGEHKIFEHIRQFPEFHKDTNTVIYGLDADLIMLSMNHLPISTHIFLFRETPHFIQSIHSELEPNASYMLDIPELAKTITLDMNHNKKLTT
jgi:5'-3' exonuclease